MNKHLRSLFTLAAGIALALSSPSRGSDPTPPSTGGDPSGPNEPVDGGGDNQDPGSIGGHEIHGFMLQPVTDAAAGSSGWVVICQNTTPPSLRVVTFGQSAGTYTVNVTSKVDGSVTALGTYDVTIPVDPIPLFSIAIGAPDPTSGNLPFFGFAALDLPAGFDPANIASVQIADATGLTLLSGDNVPHDTTPGGRDHQHEQFVLQPTADAPADARGHAEIEVQDPNAATTGTASLHLETTGLADGTYTVNVTKLADGSVVSLGTFDVAAATSGGEVEPSETETNLTFPDGLLPTDVASVQVADSTGLVLLSGDGTVRGGQVEGSENLHERVILQATTDAPAGSSGVAEIEAHNREGVSKAVLDIRTNGLVAGTYTVSVTSTADGSVTVLGTFDVAGTAAGEDGDVAFDSTEQNGLAFPDGFNPLDVASLQVADANGVVVLTGDFANVAATAITNFSAKVRVTPGPGAPKARGTASASTHVLRHKVRQAFTLVAKGAPAGSTLTVSVNGTAVGSVKTNRRGGVIVRKLGSGVEIHKTTSVSLQDASGTTVLSAHF